MLKTIYMQKFPVYSEFRKNKKATSRGPSLGGAAHSALSAGMT
jgi:hypothetical protein